MSLSEPGYDAGMLPISVLVVENEELHQEQIRTALAGAGYHTEVISGVEQVLLLNYKAGHSDRQIIVMDLDLGAGAKDAIDSGMQVLRRDIWPLDRPAVFIVFSRMLQTSLDIPRAFKRIEPQSVFVQKVVGGNGSITEKSLDDLKDVLNEVKSVIIPSMEQCNHTALRCLRWLDDYARITEGYNGDIPRVSQGIVRSVETLNRLGREAISYARIGAKAARVSIGVYGSAGRLEARKDSDIEFSVYFDSELPDDNSLSVGLWNRMFMFCEQQELRPEGRDIIDDNDPKLLTLADVGESDKKSRPSRNTYAPILSATWLLNEKARKVANIRNRHRQLLFEARAIFNAPKLFDIKRQIIQQYVLNTGTDIVSVFGAVYWKSLLDQFELDAGLESFTTRSDVKVFCYRVMGMFAIRLLLIEQIICAGQDRIDADQWPMLTDQFCDPSLVKLLRSVIRISERAKEIVEASRTLITTYASLLGRMEEQGYTEYPEKDRPLIQVCTEDARRIAGACRSLLSILKAHPAAERVRMRGWLLESPELDGLTGKN